MLGLSSIFSAFGSGPHYECKLKGFPVSVINRHDLEAGSRLVLPPSVLQGTTQAGATTPLLFEICSEAGVCRTHGGVLEFTAPDQMCYVPSWMLRQLGVQEGETLHLALRRLPKATFVRFKPDSVALMRVYNPRALLENGLRGFVALTEGDKFSVEYNGARYGIEVVEVRPSEAACIIDTDVEVEFATPKEAVAAAERSRSHDGGAASTAASRSPSRPREDVPGAGLFGGAGQRIDGGDPTEEEEEVVDPMPWRSRIPKGVKWKTPPYGCERIRIVGEAAPGRSLMPVAPAGGAAADGGAAAPAASRPSRGQDAEEARLHALEAAEERMAAQAEEIERRRQEEKARQLAAAKEAEEQAKREAAEKAKRRRAELQAPGQSRMDGSAGATGGKGAKDAAPPGGFAVLCGCCCRGSRGGSTAGQRPEVSI